MTISRRKFLQGLGAGVAAANAPWAAAQSEPIRVGLLTVKTGPLASGGIDMERALVMYLRERNNTLAGRKVDAERRRQRRGPGAVAHQAAGAGREGPHPGPDRPARRRFGARGRTTTSAAQQLPTLSVAAAEDMTQRKPNPWFVRATSTSSQCAQPLADYCSKTLKYRRMAVMADDIAYGHEMVAGFQRVFEEAGGKVVQKMFSPLTVPDYGTYIAQLKTNVDGFFIGFAGSNGFRYLRQFNEYGLRGKVNVVGGMTALDEAVLRNMGDEALGIVTTCWYSAELDNPVNRKFAPAFRAEFKYDPGFYAAATYTNGAVLRGSARGGEGQDRGQAGVHGRAEERRRSSPAAARCQFDEYGNVVGSVYIRQVERKDGRLVNSVIFTYPAVSQFWTYDPKAFLANPVYSRDWPPAKNLES